MKVVNPLYRELDNQETAAHACKCICNTASGNFSDGNSDGFWSFSTSCGCACASDNPTNDSYNNNLAFKS